MCKTKLERGPRHQKSFVWGLLGLDVIRCDSDSIHGGRPMARKHIQHVFDLNERYAWLSESIGTPPETGQFGLM